MSNGMEAEMLSLPSAESKSISLQSTSNQDYVILSQAGKLVSQMDQQQLGQILLSLFLSMNTMM